MRYINATQVKILWAAALNVLQSRGDGIFIGDRDVTAHCYFLVHHEPSLIKWDWEKGTYSITDEGRKYL